MPTPNFTTLHLGWRHSHRLAPKNALIDNLPLPLTWHGSTIIRSYENFLTHLDNTGAYEVRNLLMNRFVLRPIAWDEWNSDPLQQAQHLRRGSVDDRANSRGGSSSTNGMLVGGRHKLWYVQKHAFIAHVPLPADVNVELVIDAYEEFLNSLRQQFASTPTHHEPSRSFLDLSETQLRSYESFVSALEARGVRTLDELLQGRMVFEPSPVVS